MVDIDFAKQCVRKAKDTGMRHYQHTFICIIFFQPLNKSQKTLSEIVRGLSAVRAIIVLKCTISRT